MKLNDLGRVLRTNGVEIGPERVTKTFSKFAVSMLWAFLERKPYFSARERYEREKSLIIDFSNHPELITPTLLDFDDVELILVFKTLGLTDLVQIFQDSNVHVDDKMHYLKMAFEQLRAIHNTGKSHGDPYLKNFFLVDEGEMEGSLYTCDFEYERRSPDKAVTDVLILTANSIDALVQANKSVPGSVFSLVREVYGRDMRFPFDVRDRVFFTLRFGMGREFYDNF